METLRLLVVDDHALFRKGLVALLRSQPDLEVVGEADSGEQALKRARETMPDIVLMDIMMPEGNGLEATLRIKEEMPQVKIIILTISETEEDLFEAVKSGAQGYLLKDLEPEDLYRSLRGVFHGEVHISPFMAAKMFNEFTDQSHGYQHHGISGDLLSPREREVLSIVKQGATNRDIAAALFISENTVKNHLSSILDKLHLHNRVQAAAYALEKGLGPTRDMSS
ncbi:MAG: response regulator transcription factor [Chloroflexi bacterium]|nr:response regulator transcription factor [Chloroflexota bacterium]